MTTLIQIKWGVIESPSSRCSYDNLKGEHPLGDLLITWKSWKQYPSFDIESDTLGWVGTENSIDDAKINAQQHYDSIIVACIVE